MPLYDFACRACDHRFEELTASEAAPPDCPECGAGDVEKLMSQFSGRMKFGIRGAAARDSDGRRGEREAARRERLAETKKKRKRGEIP